MLNKKVTTYLIHINLMLNKSKLQNGEMHKKELQDAYYLFSGCGRLPDRRPLRALECFTSDQKYQV